MGCERDHDSRACPSAPGRIEIQFIEVGKAAADLEGKCFVLFLLVCLKQLSGI